MTEQKAIKELRFLKPVDQDYAFGGISNASGLAVEIAIKALEEVQQYRAIGTLEVCREAVEKQKEKKPKLWGDGYADGVLVYDMYECPNCGKNYEVDYEKYDHCPNCGQKIDWSDSE